MRPQPSSLLDIQDNVVCSLSATYGKCSLPTSPSRLILEIYKANIEPANTTASNGCVLDESDDLINFDDAAAVLN
jgi:hypothetical protein